MKQIEVQIMGQGYVLGCPEGGETRLGQAVAKVDEAMCKIRDAGKIKARDRIAVLAALNLAFDLTDKPVPAASGEMCVAGCGGTPDQLQTITQAIRRKVFRCGHDVPYGRNPVVATLKPTTDRTITDCRPGWLHR